VRHELPDREKMLKMATHEAAHLIDAIEYHTDLGEAVAPFQMVVGSTARGGRHRAARAPRDMAAEILPLLAANRVALLFGPEDRGLTNDDLKFCQLVATIPTAEFSSLNLAQAVAIICYEIRVQALAPWLPPKFMPRQASVHELEGMYRHLETTLRRIEFLKGDDPSYWMRKIRLFVGRLGLRAREVKIIRGVCRQFLWHQDRLRRGDEKPNVPPGSGKASSG